jgi:hypothetical protein
LTLNEKLLNLIQRIEKLYYNYSVCDNNCEYDKINITNWIVSCTCSPLLDIDSKIENPHLNKKHLVIVNVLLSIL